ncbi:MAG: asparaginase [Halobacteriovoraceae bacterium]|nr:asparaginase [Halobacteriovoraceae bacterium]
MEKNPVQKITLLTTGGTIEKTYDEIEGTLFNRETVVRKRIEDRLRLPWTRIEIRTLMAKDSLDMTDEDRQFIISSIKYAAGQGHPIVILHGTDSMQDTAELCALSYNPTVPVVFTGAMKPLGFEDSDAIQNVTEAMMVAKIVNPGVYISFHNRLFEVPGARKNKAKRTFEAY